MACDPQKRAWVASILFLLGATATGLANPNAPRARAVVDSSVSITLDGRLEELVWRDATVLTLVQQSPKPGQPSPYETEVRVVVTKDRIYFGFVCKDPHPNQAGVHTMRRDGDMKGDD